MILLLAPATTTEMELNRLKLEYFKYSVFVEKNVENKWEIIETEKTYYPLSIPYYPYYPTITYTNFASSTSDYKDITSKWTKE